MILIPIRMETVFTRIPFANGILIAIISIISICALLGIFSIQDVEEYILRDWNLEQLVGNTFLHANFMHLLGNMLFLWIFGNAICAAVGNMWYPLLYIFLGIIASSSQLLSSDAPSLGASGAINGIVGMVLVLLPLNRLRCWYLITLPFFWKSGKFEIKSFWMILLWLVFDIIGILSGGGGIAYGAHLGGFIAGTLAGFSLLLFNVVETYDTTLIDILKGQRKERETYDLDELKEVALKRLREPVQSQQTHPDLRRVTDAVIKSASVPIINYKSEPIPVLRVLNLVKKENITTIFFVNEGDTINGINIQSASVPIIEFNPASSLGKRTPGWIKVQELDSTKLEGFSFSLSYNGGIGNRLTRELVYNVSQKRFLTQ